MSDDVMTPDTVDYASLRNQAEQIAEIGQAEDSVLGELAKGLSVGILSLLSPLAKAKKVAKADEGKKVAMTMAEDEEEVEGDEDAEGDEGDEDAEDNEGADEPGYDDMQMGDSWTGAETDDDQTTVDVTEYLQSLAKAVNGLHMRLDNIERGQRADRATIKSVRSDLAQVSVGLAQTLAPLSKAVVTTQRMLLEVPEETIDLRDSARARQRARARHRVASNTPAVDLDMVKLAKAQAAGIIDEYDLRHFKAHGAFPRDDAGNTKLIEEIDKLTVD